MQSRCVTEGHNSAKDNMITIFSVLIHAGKCVFCLNSKNLCNTIISLLIFSHHCNLHVCFFSSSNISKPAVTVTSGPPDPLQLELLINMINCVCERTHRCSILLLFLLTAFMTFLISQTAPQQSTPQRDLTSTIDLPARPPERFVAFG